MFWCKLNCYCNFCSWNWKKKKKIKTLPLENIAMNRERYFRENTLGGIISVANWWKYISKYPLAVLSIFPAKRNAFNSCDGCIPHPFESIYKYFPSHTCLFDWSVGDLNGRLFCLVIFVCLDDLQCIWTEKGQTFSQRPARANSKSMQCNHKQNISKRHTHTISALSQL